MKYRPTNKLNRGFKERTIISDLINEYPQLVANKKIQGGSSNRRPDIFIDMTEYCIVVEIDERQHRSYQYSKDSVDRLKDIQNDINNRPLVIIRFNPDKFKTNGKLNRSLFSKTKCSIESFGSNQSRVYKIGCPKKYTERLNVLKMVISFYMNNIPQSRYTEHKLYFDGFKEDALITLIQTMIRS